MSVMNPAGFYALAESLLAGCAAPPQLEQSDNAAPLKLESFFAGRTEGEGFFRNSWIGGERRFRVVIDGHWDGEILTLIEDFAFADGETDRKTWRFHRRSSSTYVGTREDVVGEAMAWRDGKAVRLAYSVELGGWIVGFMDVLGLRADGSLVNRATVGKWGVRLARVELVLRKAGS